MSLYRFLFRGGNAADLVTLNETPLRNEGIGAPNAQNLKLGDGSTAFNSLPWLLPPFAAAAGTNTITITFTAKPVLVDGLTVYIRAAGANTGAVTFNPNGLGAVAVTKLGGSALVANDISAAGHELILRYRASVPTWELLNPAPTAAGGGTIGTGTSFPGGASASDLFFRTDLGYLCFYDGTRWLTVQEIPLFGIHQAGAAGGSTINTVVLNSQLPSTTYEIYMTRWMCTTYVTTTNDGTRYWTVTLSSQKAAGLTTVASITTQSEGADQHVEHETAINAVLASTEKNLVALNSVRTGATPGTILINSTVFCRLIIT